MKTQKNTVILIPITIEVHWSYFLLFVAKDGEDGNGLKLEKTGQCFSSLETMSSERRQELNTNSSLCHKYISYLPIELIPRSTNLHFHPVLT